MSTKTETVEQTTPKAYRVIFPYVTVKTTAMGGILPGRSAAAGMIIGLYHGGILPPGVEQAEIDRLLRREMIEEVPQ